MLPEKRKGETVTEWAVRNYQRNQHLPSGWSVVRVYSDQVGIGMGTLVRQGQGDDWLMITAAHLFNKPGKASFFTVQPVDPTGRKYIFGLSKITRTCAPNGEMVDAAICRIATRGIPSLTGVYDETLQPRRRQFWVDGKLLSPVINARLLLNGSRIRFKAVLRGEAGESIFKCDDVAHPGMSGLGAIDREGNFYILSHSITSGNRGTQWTQIQLMNKKTADPP